MGNSKNLHIAVILSSLYILIAFAWWTMLLMKKNTDAERASIEVLRYEMKSKGLFIDEVQFKATPQYFDLEYKYRRQRFMVWGEGSVLFVGLLLGVWLINRSFLLEIALANQRRNFLLSITHELKSPIASIQLVLQTFQKRKLDETQQAKLLHSASVETDRLNELVTNLLLSAKLDAAYEPYFEEIKATTMVDDLIEKFRLKFPQAQFHYNKGEDIPILRGDKQGMISVFSNLIENAVKYSGTDAKINISQKFENQYFVFDVSDNGVGISPNERKKVFEKFYRVGSEMTRKTKGTGLGLYIVEQIVKLHNGTIQILDNKPKGTTFRITLPS
ncbi:MAG: HAMP domain-containing histidine kinase [Saprospiraceae bacterium]|nr:HAMP domain-containing histidine kinase [Saprospiraceae bacterium]